MKFNKLLITLLLLTLPAWAGDEAADFLARYEQYANPWYPTGFQELPINAVKQPLSFFEIPATWLGEEKSSLPPEVLKTLYFEKDGKGWVRWIVHPDDLSDGKSGDYIQVQKWIAQMGGDTSLHSGVEGYKTSSRSLIIETPDGKDAFSLKVSTNYLKGKLIKYGAKQHSWADAKNEGAVFKYLRRLTRKIAFKYFDYLDEPLIIGGEDLKRAMSVRVLRPRNPVPGTKLIPGFTALDEIQGPVLARTNGFENPNDFFRHTLKLLGNAVAEKLATTGMISNSLHSQNYLFEVDENLKLTGRIIFRDESDAYFLHVFFEQTGNLAEWLNFTENGKLDHFQVHLYPPFRGIAALPKWLDPKLPQSEFPEFTDAFTKTFTELTGVKIKNSSDPWYHEQDVLHGGDAEIWESSEAKTYFKKMRALHCDQALDNQTLEH